MISEQINKNKNEIDHLIAFLLKFKIPYKSSDEGIFMEDIFSKQKDSSQLPSYYTHYIIKNTKSKIFVI